MRNISRNFENNIEDSQIAMLDEIKEIVKSNNISAKELVAAYEKALGVPDENVDEGESLRSGVVQLAEKIDYLTKNGLATNRVGEYVNEMREHDRAYEDYISMLDKMGLSAKETTLLKSLVEKKRIGELVITNKETMKGNPKLEITGDMIIDQNEIAKKLIELIKPYSDQKIEIMFTE